MDGIRKQSGRDWRRQRDGGYLLLSVMLLMAMMIIAATIVAPRVIQQMKRDREEEMIHRGTEYARAIKKFYKKNGRYPASLDDLDKGQVRYLRHRYKDPLTKDGKWKLLNYGDIQTLINSAAPGVSAASLGTVGGTTLTPGGTAFPNSSSGFGFVQPNQQQAQQPGLVNGYPSNSDQGGNAEAFPGGSFSGTPTGSDTGFGGGTNQPATPGNQPGGTGNQQGGTTFGQNSDNTTFGGGAIVGVASLSKDPTIRIFNKKKTYNEWQFIYNPVMDQSNVLLRGPYQPTTIGGAQIGTPAGQLNGQQQSPFGQPSSGFGQQPNPPSQYQPQPVPPGSRFPPDQNQQQ